MNPTLTYSLPILQFPARSAFFADPCVLREPDLCPHTYGVRVGLCTSFATDTCRPTACISIAQSPSVH